MSQPRRAAWVLEHGPGLRRTTLLALVLGVPTVFLWDVTQDPFNAPKLALLVVGTALALGIWGAEALSGGRPLPLPLIRPALLLGLPVAVAWLAADGDYKGWGLLGAYRRYEGLLPILLVVAVGLLVADSFRGNVRPLARTVAAAAGVVSLYAVAQSVGVDPFDVPITTEYAPSTIGHSNFVGGFVAIALPIVLALWWTENGSWRVIAMAVTVVVVLALAFVYSQGGWAAAVGGVAAFIGIARRGTGRALLLGLGSAAVVAVALTGVVIAGLFLGGDSPIPGTARARAMWWRSSVGMALDSPIWGHGPNVYAIEGGHHRTFEDALAHGAHITDSPHSVPLSYLANSGVLGLSGFVLVAAWSIRHILRTNSRSIMTAGFGAAVIAYLVQSLVSIDSLVLSFSWWVCLGGLVAASFTEAASEPRRAEAPPWRRRVALGVALMVLVASGWWSIRFLRADVHVADAVAAFGDEQFERGQAEFRAALDLRFDPEYKSLFIESLGTAALQEPAEGKRYAATMREQASYLNQYPSVLWLSAYADRMHQWAAYDAAARLDALRAFRDALALDPRNPLLTTSTAEAYVHAGRLAEAYEIAHRLQRAIASEFSEYRERYPQVPAMASIAAALSGDEAAAQSAQRAALAWSPAGATTDCHVIIASALVSGRAEDYDSIVAENPNLLLCPPATLGLLPGFDPAALVP